MGDFFLPAKRGGGNANVKRLNSRTRKRKTENGGEKPKKKRKVADDEVLSESSDEGAIGKAPPRDEESSEDPFAHETPLEKRTRLAKEILSGVKENLAESDDDPDHDAIAHRLQQDAIKATGRYKKRIAEQLKGYEVDPESITRHRKHRLPPTCVTISADERYVFSGSKDGSIVRWDVQENVRTVFPGSAVKRGHSSQVLTVAVSDDGAFLASGGMDKQILVWKLKTEGLESDNFDGHRGAVMGLAFRENTHELYSCSGDRTVKLWNAGEMAYIETLFGHEETATSIDVMHSEKPVSVGSDRTLRVWKVSEQKQLQFTGHSASIDCLSMINEQNFFTGSQDGSLALWSASKQKPLVVRRNAHGGAWITAVAAFRNSDLLASGASDGVIRLWQTREKLAGMDEIATIPMVGFVNGLRFSKSGKYLVAVVGQEHRLGRWERIKEARNSVCVIPLPLQDNVEVDRS